MRGMKKVFNWIVQFVIIALIIDFLYIAIDYDRDAIEGEEKTTAIVATPPAPADGTKLSVLNRDIEMEMEEEDTVKHPNILTIAKSIYDWFNEEDSVSTVQL